MTEAINFEHFIFKCFSVSLRKDLRVQHAHKSSDTILSPDQCKIKVTEWLIVIKIEGIVSTFPYTQNTGNFSERFYKNQRLLKERFRIQYEYLLNISFF